jgi:hypothetical protein
MSDLFNVFFVFVNKSDKYPKLEITQTRYDKILELSLEVSSFRGKPQLPQLSLVLLHDELRDCQN